VATGGGAVERLMAELRRLPGVGERTAERLAYHLLQVAKAEALELAQAIRDARERVRVCGRCFHLDEQDPCRICADETRDHGQILVVEDPRDVNAFDAAGYRGAYHVLQGRIAPLEGIGAADLTLAELQARVAAGGVREVCLATTPDLEGETTAMHVRDLLAPTGVPVTRIARGIPAGASIRHVQKTILTDALSGRRPLSDR
jgi:recombination protein RecR